MGESGSKPRYESVIEGAGAYLREEIATAAVAKGYAALHGSPEAIKRVEELRGGKSFTIGSTSDASYKDLGDPVGLQRAYDEFKAERANRDVEAAEVAQALG